MGAYRFFRSRKSAFENRGFLPYDEAETHAKPPGQGGSLCALRIPFANLAVISFRRGREKLLTAKDAKDPQKAQRRTFERCRESSTSYVGTGALSGPAAAICAAAPYLRSIYPRFLEYFAAYCGTGISALHRSSGIGVRATVSSGTTPAQVRKL
jgi:hypothetical protein